MDRETLVRRNRSMAEAFHAVPLKHQLRRAALQAAAAIPVPTQHRSQQNERILLLRPDHLGDVLLTTPAIHALRAAHPDSELHALVGPWSASVLANFSDLDLVLTLPYPGFTRQDKLSWRSPYQLAATTARSLRRIGYDTAIILRPDHWWGALVAHLAGIPRRIGYNLPDVAPFLTESHESAARTRRRPERALDRAADRRAQTGRIGIPVPGGRRRSRMGEWLLVGMGNRTRNAADRGASRFGDTGQAVG